MSGGVPGKLRTCESGEVWVQAGEGEGPSVAAENLKFALTIYLREYLLGVFRSPVSTVMASFSSRTELRPG